MKTRRIWAEEALLVTLGLVAAGCGDSPTAPNSQQAELDAARAVASTYQDPATALRDGFIADPVCIESPAGAMGIHYVNPGRMDGSLRVDEPEILLYLPEAGRLRLVAVEYFQPIIENGVPYFGATAPANPGPTPTLFGGQRFDGPMAGHIPQMPWHFDLHVWVGVPNPAGMFAQFNPTLSCS